MFFSHFKIRKTVFRQPAWRENGLKKRARVTELTAFLWKKGKGGQIGGPDRAGKRQPGLTPGLKNGNDVRTLELEFVALNELGEHPDPLYVFIMAAR